MKKLLSALVIGSLMGMTSCKTIDSIIGNDGDAPVVQPAINDFPQGITVAWIGPDGSKATVENKLHSVVMAADGKKINYDYEKLNWPISDNIDSILCAFFMRDGVLKGGKYEWSRPGMKSQTPENIRGGYIKGIKPIVGEDVYFCIMTPDKKIRTNAMKFVWVK